ncbi:TetR/AcrR family transcriptional regulator [Virgisporangium aurantiacum]|uniref:TetR family transcriptional regulator n=1 Tax=Virgisporangium aurantiacum TaxID=175570 RepID=A0A8J3ZDE5_9ACTN|nr:TetR/AcrR family transcriptional regulator [Virgisporangium aurantiacum]GIJ59586.1 TetR family transcriptional regulator [Virgisporangium aurantiacum]
MLNSERARPLPPDERRASLVAAAIPLIAEHGLKVTTKQIATAAGVAEGTIFRVFTDKTELIQAAINTAFDPERTLAELGAIDIGLPLFERCLAITRVLQDRLVTVFKIMIAMRMAPGQPKYRPKQGNTPGQVGPPGSPGASFDPRTEQIFHEIVRLLEPDSARFTSPVKDVANILRLLTFSGSHPYISDGNLLTAEQITSTVLDGVRRRPDTPDHGGPRC